MTTSADCGCVSAPNGVPKRYKVTIAGVTNGSCGSNCANFNGDFYLDKVAGTAYDCLWEYNIGATWCLATGLTLSISGSGNNLAILVGTKGGSIASWSLSRLEHGPPRVGTLRITRYSCNRRPGRG